MPPDVPLHVRFPRGCRVRFSAEGRAGFPLSRDVPAVVVGYARDERCLYIRRDGNTWKESLHHKFVERLDADMPEDPARVTARCRTCQGLFSYLRLARTRRYCSVRCRTKMSKLLLAQRRRPPHA
jgi:hypothetical protein